MQQTSLETIQTLVTVRDYIRWAASRFSEAKLFHGHGTATPLDDAAALVLHALHLPYNLSESYFSARLTEDERHKLVDLINRRINTRIPSAYLMHEAVFAGLDFYVDERVLVPRSPIAELIREQFSPWVDADQVLQILDLCTGSGCIAIACAYAFPDAHVDAVDLSEDALEVAKINVAKHEVEEQLTLYHSDLFKALPAKKYDLIVSNPPYVAIAEWEQLPDEFHAEPEMGFTGGESGLDLVIKILVDAADHINDQGVLIIEVGSSAQTLQTQFPDAPFYWLDFEHGGDGVFLLTAEQVFAFNELFKEALG
ncbi:MAG: 50S ribosomal protein L3 N(5)-glutamine methyltransferase [Gammaproteobacteria bacterium]|jgi:ribosomal protein L3 glutamine methyltransferase|nr:50S ribosomal protein L3 N(5)-glutamine methyltransferase [Gammaproteobacteria bacterium]MBT4146129.1 50S ribosomal protein L3 N(5)-glutamine methyltransferase [Gammaproteobacteria bacterium]MBT5223011.1 50S ribosomal protein L3 N(5)-glutamine methyltransferase [Gammaproteobacteria bacterium]MBT5825588.1 50S ribosomal protein L3 N(5)-glutamine methyltransferase [Gammaproteobacteria bacterium]MBT5967235.1 50S ribosomal protein L3 N(5)-glutamine methyltransferase [Gammaproteobacteria bacterium